MTHHELDESISFLRESIDSAASAPAAIGWQTEEWLRRRESARQDLTELLDPPSIEAEMELRDDLPSLLAHLVSVVRGASAPA